MKLDLDEWREYKRLKDKYEKMYKCTHRDTGRVITASLSVLCWREENWGDLNFDMEEVQ